MHFDAFISHATEDKDDVARPLALQLKSLGYEVWFDEQTLKIGDSLRRSIEYGLQQSRFGVVVLSHAFFQKQWTQYELDCLTSRELTDGRKVILPIWHNMSRTDICRYSLNLADKVAISSSVGVAAIAVQLQPILGAPEGIDNISIEAVPCSNCGKPVVSMTYRLISDGTTSGGYVCLACGNVDAWGVMTDS